MDNQLIPKDQHLQPAQIQADTTTLNQLASLCQDDDWLMELIQDTENHQMITAPNYIETAVLSKTEESPHPLSRRLKLIYYSLKVSLAAAAIILFLFTAPFFPEQSTRKNTPPGSKNTARQHTSLFEPDFGTFHPPEAGRKLKDSLWRLSDSIYDLSSEFIQGGNLHD